MKTYIVCMMVYYASGHCEHQRAEAAGMSSQISAILERVLQCDRVAGMVLSVRHIAEHHVTL